MKLYRKTENNLLGCRENLKLMRVQGIIETNLTKVQVANFNEVLHYLAQEVKKYSHKEIVQGVSLYFGYFASKKCMGQNGFLEKIIAFLSSLDERRSFPLLFVP